MFKSTHNLDFETAEFEHNTDPNELWVRFRVGSCTGLWRSTDESYNILAIGNKRPNNGHLDDVLEWFGESCKRDKKSLIIQEFMNNDFKQHLIDKKGFKKLGKDNLIKHYDK